MIRRLVLASAVAFTLVSSMTTLGLLRFRARGLEGKLAHIEKNIEERSRETMLLNAKLMELTSPTRVWKDGEKSGMTHVDKSLIRKIIVPEVEDEF